MKHELHINGLSEIEAAAKEFLRLTASHRLIAFYAPMGAGKTTFTTAICNVLGISGDAVSSPTFSIVNEYRLENGDSLYHFDFYRINKIPEVLDIGLFDYLDSGSLCIMEWPENVEEILPEETLKVFIRVAEDESRILTWEDRN